MVDRIFPEKTVTISTKDKPYFTEELRQLRRQRQRAYRDGGKTDKYLALVKKFDEKLKKEVEKYRQKVLAEVAEGSRTSSYKALRRLETGEHACKKDFTIPSYSDLTPAETAEKLAEHFSKISHEFDPINADNFPPWIKKKLLEGKTDPAKPYLEDWQVYAKLRKSRKPDSIVPDGFTGKID